MGKWEYMIATLEENEELKILNKLGNEGWQLVAVTCTTDLGIWDGNG